MKKVLCPVCWHKETLRAINLKCEPNRDDVETMQWRRLAEAEYITARCWQCETCGISLRRHIAALLIDAVLRVSDLDSDSFDGENFEDALEAASGGEE